MKIVEVLLNVDSTEEAKKFYCDDLKLFSFYYDYGMDTISLFYNNNPSFRLTLYKRNPLNIDTPIFKIEVDSCDKAFKDLQETEFKTKGSLISESVFEYPLGKNILLQDPSKNKFLIIENYYPNIGK